MPKLDYFDALSRISVLSARAVFIACTPIRQSSAEIVALRRAADKIVCDLECFLFSDFMPPLDRSSISLCAHSLERIIEKSSDIIANRQARNFFGERKNKEAELCIRLSQLIEKATASLKSVKRPEHMPDIVEFRRLLCDARFAHASLQKKLNAGLYPRAAQHTLCLLGSLRSELARAFDVLIEVMLTNV